MARIEVEKGTNRSTQIWGWILGLLILLAAIWLLFTIV
jgi:hypothetical protein